MKRIFLGLILITVSLIFSFSGSQNVAYTQGGSGLAPDGVEGETYYAPFPVAITLDGEFEDWDGVPEVYLGQGVGRPAVSFYAAADTEFLYLHANIVDPNIISGEHGENYWNEDSLEFYLNGTGDFTMVSYQDGVAQLTIPALNRNLPSDEAILAGVRGATLNAKTFSVETDNGWAVEVAIPLESEIWSITPEHGGEMGFQVHLNAASELNRDTKLVWSIFDTGDISYQNPSVFGRLIFHQVSDEPMVASGEYFFASSLSEDGTLDDFENGIWLGEDAADNAIGFVPQASETALAIRQVLPSTAWGLPNQEEVTNVLAIENGAFHHNFTDGRAWVSQDWSAYTALGLWLYSGDAEQTHTLAIVDSLEPTAEAWVYTLADSFSGWRYVVVPLALFENSTSDSLNLAEIRGYGVSTSIGTAFVDDVRLVNVENPSQAIVSESQPRGAFILDESINWESRAWDLVWANEFEGASGTPIDAESWTCEVGGHGWGNNELEYYTTNTENVALDGAGNLAINAIQGGPEDGTCWYGACAYTSARCTTQDKVEFTFGRVEARLRIPFGQGIWPAFWMLGSNFSEVGWPNSGEIDIMENIGSEPQMVHGTIHGPGYSGASGLGNSYSLTEDFSADFHVYAIEWDYNVIRWYVDGELFSTLSTNDLRNREWVYNHDFFLIMNVAVGGAWPGFPNEDTTFPQTMLVDYVRVYELAE